MTASALKSVKANARTVNLLFNAFGDGPEIKRALLKGTDISPTRLNKRKSQVSVADELTVIDNIAKLKGNDWIWRYPELWKEQTSEALDEAMLSAPTCGEALNIMTRFGYLWGPNHYIEQFKQESKKGYRRFLTLGTVSEFENRMHSTRMVRDISIMYIYNRFKLILGNKISDVELWFSGDIDIPESVYKRIISCPIKTGKPRTAFSLPEELCEQSSLAANKTSYNKAVMALLQLTAPLSTDDAFERKVKNYLSAVTDGRPNAAEVASVLGVSQRTLNRRLQNGGTSFRDLLEASLSRRADKLLAGNTLSRAQISERLGYNDQASFSRALKRWRENA